MSAERAPEQGQQLRFVAAAPDEGISAWLGVLVRLLRVPASEAEAIREELESHLRERVRDLEVSGMGEVDAVKRAVSELGDAAALARRYREARAFPRRRLMMNLSMLAMAGAAVALSVVTLSQPGESTRVSVFEPPAPTPAEHAALSKKFEGKFEAMPLRDVFAYASQTIGAPITVVWRPMEVHEVGPDTEITLYEKSADFPALLRGVSDQITEYGQWALDYRVVDGVIKVATDEYFDQREILLASYDMSGFAGAVSSEEVTELIQKFVHSPGWESNGGSMARLYLVGSKMFVEAPKRYHAEIKWFINELSKEPGQAARDALDRDRAALADEGVALRAQVDAKAAQDAVRAADHAALLTEVVRAEHAKADELVAIIRDREADQAATRVKMASDPRSNSIILSGAEADLAAVRDVIAQLDAKAAADGAGEAEKGRLWTQLRQLEAQLAEYRRAAADQEAARSGTAK